MRLALMMLTGLMVLSAPALADDRSDFGLPPDGHTMVNLSATENKKVDQDLLVSSLRMEVKDESNLEVQDKINETMQKAVAIAKKYDKLKIETGGYSLYESREPIRPVDSKEGEQDYEVLWRGSQNLTIQSTDAKSVLEATREMQALGLVMNGLNYTLSPEKAETIRDELMVLALQKLKSKAALVAKTLDKSGYELTRVAMDGQMPSPPVMMRGYAKAEMAMASDMAAPVAEAGESTVSVTVSADALLKP